MGSGPWGAAEKKESKAVGNASPPGWAVLLWTGDQRQGVGEKGDLLGSGRPRKNQRERGGEGEAGRKPARMTCGERKKDAKGNRE